MLKRLAVRFACVFERSIFAIRIRAEGTVLNTQGGFWNQDSTTSLSIVRSRRLLSTSHACLHLRLSYFQFYYDYSTSHTDINEERTVLYFHHVRIRCEAVLERVREDSQRSSD